jgi:hypothetical protein
VRGKASAFRITPVLGDDRVERLIGRVTRDAGSSCAAIGQPDGAHRTRARAAFASVRS